jgi:signal transduction histidine kinase
MKSARLNTVVLFVLFCLLFVNRAEVQAGTKEVSGSTTPGMEQSIVDHHTADNSENYITVEEINIRYIYNFLTIIIMLLGGMTFFSLKQRSQRKKVVEQNLLLAQRKKHLEKTLEELKETEMEIRSLNQVQNRILSIIGQDMRGPLGNLYEYFKLYASKEIKLEESDFLPFMEECSHQMGSVFFLAENLLAWAKNENSDITGYPGNYSLMKIAKETKELMGLLAMNKGISLNVDIEEEFRARCDYNQIASVLRNLVSNAIKFTNIGGSITLSCKYLKNEFILSVTDTGIGMEQNQLNLLIERKSSFSTPGTDNEPGTGLGLSIVSEFVEKNGGKLIGSSCPGQGTSFTFSLPVASDYDVQFSNAKSGNKAKELIY